MTKSIYCFAHGGHASEHGAKSIATEYGVRHFCAKCAHLADGMPAYIAPPRTEPETPSQPAAIKPIASIRAGGSMASWVRAQHDAGQSVEAIIAALPTAFPDSKPGLNVKLAPAYVRCYLKK